MSDSDFDAAWREFAREDAGTTAPARLGPAVMRAWDSAQHERNRVDARSRTSRRMPLVAMLSVAAAVLVAVAIMTMRETDRSMNPGQIQTDVAPVLETTSAAVSTRAIEPDPDAAPKSRSVTAPRVHPAITRAGTAPADAVRLIADPTFETESFELVRLRLPRTSLEAIGVVVIGPEVTNLVDVDVVVGGDGLPRSIRNITPVIHIR